MFLTLGFCLIHSTWRNVLCHCVHEHYSQFMSEIMFCYSNIWNWHHAIFFGGGGKQRGVRGGGTCSYIISPTVLWSSMSQLVSTLLLGTCHSGAPCFVKVIPDARMLPFARLRPHYMKRGIFSLWFSTFLSNKFITLIGDNMKDWNCCYHDTYSPYFLLAPSPPHLVTCSPPSLSIVTFW